MTTLYIAMSLDGRIAGPDNDLSWLDTAGDYGYEAFLASVQTIVMGRKTYEVVRSFGDWPYPERLTFVLSRNESFAPDLNGVSSFSGPVTSIPVSGNVWVVGGGEVAREFLSAGLIDELVLAVHPVLLGDGPLLFPSSFPKVDLKLYKTKRMSSGVIFSTYRVVKEVEDGKD